MNHNLLMKNVKQATHNVISMNNTTTDNNVQANSNSDDLSMVSNFGSSIENDQASITSKDNNSVNTQPDVTNNID